MTSKRFLRALVEAGHVEGWDDPRLPTLAGLRRRGIPPAAIRRFCAAIGLSRADDAIVDVAMLEACAREGACDLVYRYISCQILLTI